MNTLEIANYLRKNKYTRKIFRKVIPSDFLPQKVKKNRPCLFVVNFSDSHSDGSHWCSIYIDAQKFEFFDTSGQAFILNSDFQDFARRNMRAKMIYSSVAIQSMKSDICGEYCCLFALHKSRGKTLESFMRIFAGNGKIKNDYLALYLFGREFLVPQI